MKPLFEIPQIFNIDGQPLGDREPPDWDNLGKNSCNRGGGDDNSCGAGGGSGNVCASGSNE